MSWCKYCIDNSSWFSTEYKCISGGKEKSIPDGYVKWYCGDENVAYSKCPLYKGWYVTTVTCNILNKDEQDPVMNSIYGLKENVFKNDDKYNEFIEIYNIVGPIIAGRLFVSKDKDEKAASIYSRLEKMNELVKNEQNDLAAKRYIMMTLRLVSEYGLNDIYRSNIKKYRKTLDK